MIKGLWVPAQQSALVVSKSEPSEKMVFRTDTSHRESTTGQLPDDPRTRAAGVHEGKLTGTHIGVNFQNVVKQ